MLFLTEFHLKPDSKYRIAEIFEARGPNRSLGVKFRQAWVGTREDLVFHLCECEQESLVVQAWDFWKEYGHFTVHPVIDAEDF